MLLRNRDLTRRTESRRRQAGQSLVEYAIILIMVSVVVVVILISQGAAINKLFSNVACGLQVHCAPGGGGGGAVQPATTA